MNKDVLFNSYHLIGKKNSLYILFYVTIAIGWIFSDFLLVYIFQYFLLSLGAIQLNSPIVIVGIKLNPNLEASILLLILFGFLKMLLQVVKIHTTQSLFEKISAHLKILIINTVIKKPFSYSTHDIVLMFTERSGMASQFLIQTVNSFFYAIITIALFAICLYMCPKETLLVIPLILILLLPLRFFNVKINSHGDNMLMYQKSIFKNIVTALKNLNLISIYNKTESELSSGIYDINQYKKNAINYYIIYSLKTSFPYFIGIVSIAITSYISVTVFDTRKELLAPFFYLFIRGCQNLGELSGSLGESKKLQNNFLSYYQWINDSFDLISSRAKSEIDNQELLESKNLQLLVTNLSFGYPGRNELIKNLNFMVKTGSCLLVKGPSGSGKSTLLRLIMGVEAPSSGGLYLNSFPCKENSKTISKLIGYVGPENYFLEGTLRQNLLYLNDSVQDEFIFECLSKANLLEEVLGLNKGLDTYLNETVQFSTGQRQRLSIARALIRSPKILILDEATANLDIESEVKIIKALGQLKPSMLIIVISHKATFDEFADIIIELNNSK